MIRRLVAALIALIAVSTPALARASTGTAHVTVHLLPDGVRAVFVLDRAVNRFVFAPAATVRAGEFELLTPGLVFAEEAVVAPRPFRRFEIRIRPMTGERDAKYPAHFRVGTGGILYAPALKGDPEAWRTRLTFAAKRGEVVLPSTAANAPREGFVYIGPASLVSEHEGLILVAGPEAPTWLVERARTALAAAVETFAGALGARLPNKPLLIVTHQAGERNFNVGDVTPGAVTALRFHGPAWLQPDERAGKQVQLFVLHEAFHFWNGGIAKNAADAPAWLHEGGAEYAALVAARRADLLSEEEARARLADALGRCRLALENQGDKSLSQLTALSAAVRYPCGMVLQWAADLQLRGQSGGRRTVLDAWADMLRTARARTEQTYGLADFKQAVGMASNTQAGPFGLLVETSGAERWTALRDALNALGAEVRLAPSTVRRRATLLFHLLRQNCRALPENASFGFWTDEGRVKLQAPEGCGVIAGDPVLASLEGGDPFEMSLETYQAVARRCAAGEPVRLTLAQGRDVEALCADALPPPPEDYEVDRALPRR